MHCLMYCIYRLSKNRIIYQKISDWKLISVLYNNLCLFISVHKNYMLPVQYSCIIY